MIKELGELYPLFKDPDMASVWDRLMRQYGETIAMNITTILDRKIYFTSNRDISLEVRRHGLSLSGGLND